jgi:hypothetical protein
VRWSIGKTVSPRGAGLGNEVFPWAKAYLGAKALGLTFVEPPWRLNVRRYDKEISSNGLQTLKYVSLRSLPSRVVDWEMVAELGEDYFDAMQVLAPRLGKNRPVLLHTSGMSGGYPAIKRARPYLRHRLFSSPDALRVLEERERPRPGIRVGVHIRAGDFEEGEEVRPGVFNLALPVDWFAAVLTSLAERTELPIEVVLATDTPRESVLEAGTVDGRPPSMLGQNSVGDLAALSSCDLIVSSISSFSMLAIFLSDAPYVWYEPHLTSGGGWLSIWGGEDADRGGGATDSRAREAQAAQGHRPRGVAMGYDCVWPAHLIDYLETKARHRDRASDLIHYGVVPSHRT